MIHEAQKRTKKIPKIILNMPHQNLLHNKIPRLTTTHRNQALIKPHKLLSHFCHEISKN